MRAAAAAAESPELMALLLRDDVKLESVRVEKNDCEVSFTLQTKDLTRVPQRVVVPFWVATPPGGTATIQLKNAEWVVLTGDSKIEGPYKLDQNSPWGVLPPAQVAVRVMPQDDFRTVALQRGELTVAGSVTRAADNKTDTGTAIITKATLALSIQPAPGDKSAPLDLAKDDPFLESLLKMLVVNTGQIAMCPREPKAMDNEEDLRAWNELLGAAEKRGPILFSRLPRGGVYALRPGMLRQAGIAPESMPINRIRVFAGKDELSVIETGGFNEALVGEKSLVFYVPVDVADKKPFIPLWILLGGENDKPRRITPKNYGAQPGPPAEMNGTVFERIFEPKVFSHEQPLTSPMLKWSTAEIPPTGFANFEFEASHVLPDGDVKFTAWLIGADPQKIHESAYDLQVNNQSIATGEVRTGRVDNKDITFKGSVLSEGANTLSVFNPEQSNPDKANTFRFVMAEMTIPITSTGLKPQELFTASFDEPTTSSILLTRQANFKGSGYAVDVTKPLDPVFCNLGIPTDQRQYIAQVQIPSPGTQLLYSPTETFLIPPAFSVVKAPQSFTSTDQTDYLAIYYGELGPELKPLLDYHAKSMAVGSFTIDDVYAAFSYGEVSYQAVHDCIAHAFRARKSPRLREVLLVGEGSEYWWEYRRDSPDVSKNMIPVFGWQDPNVRIRGDESYALLIGTGPIADVEIARISVNNPQELHIVVNKILGYEQDPPTGEWRNKHLFVTDDEPDFITVAKAIIQKTFRPPHVPEVLKLQDYPYEDYFRGIWRKRSAEFTDKVIDEMGKGALTVTYLGHGGPNLWSSERILHIRDIDRMLDNGRHPFLVAGSCDTGWVDYPVDPVRTSLSEHFIRRENGGTIGAFIPIDGTSSYEHDFLISAFYRHLCRDNVSDFGTLCLLSKLDYYLDRNNSSVTNQYLLMGDPASQLPPLPANLEAKVDPPRMLSATGRVIKITGKTDGYDLALGHAVITDRTNIPIAETRFAVRNGDIDTTMGIPAFLTPGTYNVIVNTSNDEAKKCQAGTVSFTVEDTKTALQWTTTPDASTVQAAGKPVQFQFNVRNDTDLDLPGAEIVIDDVDTRKEIARAPASIKAHESTTPAFEKPLPAGVTTIRGRLVIPSADKNVPDTVLAESELVMRAQSDQVRYLDFPLDAVEVSRLPLNKGTRFVIPVYNMTQFALPKLAAVLKRTLPTESVPLGAEQEIESIDPGQKRILTFDTADLFDKQPSNFLLEVYDLSKDRRRLLQLTPFTYAFKSGPDVAIVPDSVLTETGNVFAGRTVYLRFTIINNGDEVANGVRPLAYLIEPWVEKNLVPNSLSWYQSEAVDKLYPGEKHTFRLRWDPSNSSSTNAPVFVAAQVVGSPADINPANNILKKDIAFLPSPNLLIDKEHLFVSTKFLEPYQRVTVRVPFLNNSPQDFVRDFRLSAYAIKSDGSRERVATRRFGQLKSGESGLMQFDWNVEPGQYSLYFNLNEDREYLEQTYDDNTASVTMPYVVADGEFGTGSDSWDFSSFPDFGMMKGVVRYPDGSLTTSGRPQGLMQKLPFDPQYLIKGALGRVRVLDNLWGQEKGHITLEYEETGPPVKFRIPLPRDINTQWYDLYFNTVGDYFPDKMS
ncbi:MAG: C25 family cysteine peptidase, partial [Candidatus Sumerlaeota bacterium]